MIGGHADADQQVEVGRRNAIGRGRADDLLQLFLGVEAEGAHAISEIGFADRFNSLHRMHEAYHGARQSLSDQAHLGDRGDVIMRHARVPQDLQQIRRGIGLHGIERPARKLLHEEAGGAPGGVRTNERDRLNRSKGGS